MGRIHINSCDFSLSSYNYDDQPGDFDLDHFDSGLIRDSMYVIPLLRRAIAASSRPLLLVASPWSPPAWMKVQSGGRTDEDDTMRYFEVMTGSAQPNGLKDDPRVKTAWASYITKFLEAYRDKGVSVWAVTPQNEPEFAAPWEACVYNASHEGDFIANYLGPILKGRLPKTKILGFDHNKDHLLQWAETLMGDPAVERYLDGMAFHWYGGNDRVTDGTYGFEAVNATHHLLRPDQILLATEGCTCPGVRIDDWLRAERLAHDVMYDLMNFGQGWIDWNLLLDSTGGPNHAGNVCDSPIVALPDYSDVHVQPKYYYFGHISKFVTPGSVRVQSSIVGDFQLRAMDPNIQAGVEMGVFSCERSVRQTWQMRAENGSDVFTLALATPALAVDSFADAPFPPDHQPVHSDLCVARGDTNRAYLRLVNCKSLENIVRFQWNEVNQLVEDGTGLCVGLAGDVLESGALLSLDSCASPSPQKQSFLADKQTGEIRLAGFDSSGLNSMCWTAGWPFLSSVAFVNPEGQTVLVVMNEGSTKIEISIVSDSFFRSKKTLIGQILDGQMHGQGKLTYENGEYYDGEWLRGTIFLASGDKYVGDWKDGRRHGSGTYFYCDGDRYDGEWRNDERHGRGVMTYSSDSNAVQEKFEGEWVDGKMQGRGIYHYSDGSVYDGNWMAGKMQGKGLFLYPNGNRYEGEFFNDAKEGYGILQYKNGERYEVSCSETGDSKSLRLLQNGQWKTNFANGTGALSYADGDKYTGEWRDGKKCGTGELLYVNGDKFSGSWLDDKASGMGRLEYCNGDSYDGQWERDHRHGWGKFLSNETGSSYDGYWKEGLKSGSGSMSLSNGDSFSGQWKLGLIDGPVTYKFADNSPWEDAEY
eukprot:gene23431-29649_t